MKKIKNTLLVIVLLLAITLISGCTANDSSKDKTIGLGETFTFDELEITLENDISFTTIDNEFSDYNGQTVVRVPITVKNLREEPHSLNMFYYSFFGSQGIEAANVSAYFDDSIDFAGDLRSGASYTKSFYFIYDGDGTYDIEFANIIGPKITVEFEINK